MGFDFIVIAPLLPSHCGFFFVFGHEASFFGGFQRPSADVCSTASCSSGAFSVLAATWETKSTQPARTLKEVSAGMVLRGHSKV